MKTYGIIIFYDGYNGLIKGLDNNNYILNYKELKGLLNTEIQKGDYVEFIPDKFATPEVDLNIARSIVKIDKEKYNSLKPKTRRHK